MICSMTAYGSARRRLDGLTLTLDVRSVNSRYLDLHLRLPDELRGAETALRERLAAQLARGKVELRATCDRVRSRDAQRLSDAALQRVATQWQAARAVLPDTPSPSLSEILHWPELDADPDPDATEAARAEALVQACLEAADEAIAQLQDARGREGARLVTMIRGCASQITEVVNQIEHLLPELLSEHRLRLAVKLRDAVETAFPSGFAHIKGEELSERLSQESAFFALRIDIAEELSRLRAHLAEIDQLLDEGTTTAPTSAAPQPEANAPDPKRASHGKRLDFLCQELNREANTLGSKAGSVAVTRHAMALKLLIEQIREQAQNLE